jgi:hypothetical protein
MNELLKKVKDIQSDCCVTIILNTHRTHPENLQDGITLKNLVKNAEERLLADYDKRYAKSIAEKLNALADSIDHNKNLDSLVLCVNEEISDFSRLPIKVTDRVTIDETFATRDLIRAMHEELSYYVLVLSRDSARLIEAYNDQVVEEIHKVFPMKNNTIYTTDKHKLSTAQGTDIMIEEWFNRVDKELQKVLAEHPRPVVLATEMRNYDHYMKVADKPKFIISHINMNRDDEKAHHIVPVAWEEVHTRIKEKQAQRISELKIAVSQNKFVSDYNEIWNAIQHGRGETLFVKRGYYQPALLVDNEIMLVDNHHRDDKGVVDDIIDEMIEQTLLFGGDVVFMEEDELDKFQNVALVTRY